MGMSTLQVSLNPQHMGHGLQEPRAKRLEALHTERNVERRVEAPMWTDPFQTAHSVCTRKLFAFSLRLSKTQFPAQHFSHTAIVCLWLTAFFMTHLVMRWVGGPHDHIFHTQKSASEKQEKGGSQRFKSTMTEQGREKKKFHLPNQSAHTPNWKFKYEQRKASWSEELSQRQDGQDDKTERLQQEIGVIF